MSEDLELNKNTISKWCLWLREIIQDHLLINPCVLGGLDEHGNKKIVEIDESLFFRKKHNVGRERPQQWVLGLIERDTKNCSFAILENRRAETIIPIILERVHPDTTIIKDCWASYRRLNDFPGFDHFTVNHRYNFLNPEDPSVHTLTIENCWSHAKERLKIQHGTRENMLEGYLFEFAFKKNILGMIVSITLLFCSEIDLIPFLSMNK